MPGRVVPLSRQPGKSNPNALHQEHLSKSIQLDGALDCGRSAWVQIAQPSCIDQARWEQPPACECPPSVGPGSTIGFGGQRRSGKLNVDTHVSGLLWPMDGESHRNADRPPGHMRRNCISHPTGCAVEGANPGKQRGSRQQRRLQVQSDQLPSSHKDLYRLYAS